MPNGGNIEGGSWGISNAITEWWMSKGRGIEHWDEN